MQHLDTANYTVTTHYTATYVGAFNSQSSMLSLYGAMVAMI